MNNPAPIYISTNDLAILQTLIDGSLSGVDEDTVDRLAAEIDRATILDPASLPGDAVTIGSRVAFVDEATGAVREVTIASAASAGVSRGLVSVLAPVGAALLGVRTGSVIEWELPNGRVARFRVRAVVQPDTPARPGHPPPTAA